MNEMQITIPKEVENLQLPSPELITYYKNLENRVLWLDTEVDDYWLEFSRKIIEWNREDKGVTVNDRKPIKLMFFSYGGSLDINNALIDTIKMSKTPVWGINVGQACSAGCFIYLSCHKRLSFPNATFLIHQGGGDGFSGTYNQVVAAVMEYQRKIEELEQYLKDNTKIPEDVLAENITTEWFLNTKEALKYGICDKIITSLDEIL
jgi:ATP-dependent Clp protease, protease subunit